MVFKHLICIFLITIIIESVRPDDMIAQNEIMDSNYSGDQISYGKRNDIDNIPPRPLDNTYGPPASMPSQETWLDSARNALSGPAGQIVVHMAKEMISRSTGNSQVILLIIL